MTGAPDPRDHAAAVKSAVTARLGPHAAYGYDEVPGMNGNPGTLPNIFVLVSVERRPNPNVRMTAQAGSTGWRVALRCVGRTVGEAEWANHHAALALNEKRLTIGDRLTTPLQFEDGPAPEFDDGRYAGRAFYTYAY